MSWIDWAFGLKIASRVSFRLTCRSLFSPMEEGQIPIHELGMESWTCGRRQYCGSGFKSMEIMALCRTMRRCFGQICSDWKKKGLDSTKLRRRQLCNVNSKKKKPGDAKSKKTWQSNVRQAKRQLCYEPTLRQQFSVERQKKLRSLKVKSPVRMKGLTATTVGQLQATDEVRASS